jgi:PKD repeat protein
MKPMPATKTYMIYLVVFVLGIYASYSQSDCGNAGFEYGNFDEWTGLTGVAQGINEPVILNLGNSGIVYGRHTLYSGAAMDIFLYGAVDIYGDPDPVYLPCVSPTGGSRSVKLGNEQVGAQCEALERTFLVTENNANYVYSFAVVLEDPGHIGRPLFEVSLTDIEGNELDCGQYLVTANAGIDGFQAARVPTINGNSTIWYRPWTDVAVNLVDYIGDSVTIKFTTSDCNAGEHFGYAYIDAYCGPLEIAADYCPGNPATLTAPPGYQTYVWTTGQYGQTIYIDDPQLGDSISCYLISWMGCTSVLTFHLDSLPVPIADFSFTNACQGDTTYFTNETQFLGNSSADSYAWYFGDSTFSDEENPFHIYQNPGAYEVTLQITSDNGCITDTTIELITSCCETPPTNIIVNQPLCHNSNVIISYDGLSSDTALYQWNFGDADIVSGSGVGPFELSFPQTLSNYNISLTVTEFDSLTGALCSTSSSDADILFPDSVGATYSTIDVLCYGDSTGQITVVPNGGTPSYTCEWGNSTIGTTVENLSQGIYFFTVTDANDCSYSDSAIIVQPINEVSMELTFSDASCFGENDGAISVHAVGGSPGYNYEWSNNFDGIFLTNLVAGDYTITVEDANGCTVKDSASISQPNEIEMNVSSWSTACFNTNSGSAMVQIDTTTGNPPYTIEWNNGSEEFLLDNVEAGTYYGIITDANGCHANVFAQVQGAEELIVSVSGDTTICQGGSAYLWASSTGGTPGYEYYWNTGSIEQEFTALPNDTVTYSVYSIDTNGCVSEEVSVTVNVLPPLDIVISYSEDSVCPGEPVIVEFQASGGIGYNYTYLLDDSLVVESPYIMHPIVSEVHYIQVSDGCTSPNAIDDYNLFVNPSPVPSISANQYRGCEPLLVQFNEHSTEPNQTYVWSFLHYELDDYSTEKNPSHLFYVPGTYDVELQVINEFGCEINLTFDNFINVYPNPTAAFEMDPLHTTIFEPEVNFFNLSSSNSSLWRWNFGDGDTILDYSPTHIYQAPGTYDIELIAYTNYGCADTVTSEILIEDANTLFAPTAFTPGAPLGENGLFSPVGYGINEDIYHLYIYDRWGEIIFETDKYDVSSDGRVNHGWDGKVKGKNLAQIGTYTWLVTYQDFKGISHEEIGSITLIR